MRPVKIHLTLEGRLKLSIGLILLAIVALGFIWSVQDAKDNVRQEAEASVRLALTLIDASRLSGSLGPDQVHAWIHRIKSLERIRHLRITANAGGEGAGTLSSLPSPPDDAAVPRWFERAVLSAPIFDTRELVLDSNTTLLLSIESRAEDEIREAWIQTRGFLLLLAIFALSVYLSVHLILGRALRPVGLILRGLHQIESGNYESRLELSGLPELDRIAEGINHLSLTLKEARDANRALTRHSLAIQEEARRTLAQEMHDEVGQSLTAIKMMSALIPESAEKRAQAALEIQRLCDRLFGVVRSIIHHLRPMMLEDLGLKAALDDLVEHWRSIDPTIHISIHCHESFERLTEENALEIYRIVQEALTNTVRHAGANEAVVRIQPCDPKHLLLTVSDNGKGLASEGVSRRGFGLLGMRERVASLDGSFDLISKPGQGLEIRIILPVKKGQDG